MIIQRLGRLAYDAGLQAQHAARERVIEGADHELLLLEHAPVVTLGRRGGVVNRTLLAELNTPVIETRRGGLATWHGPGQLVGYPIIHLGRAKIGVGDMVRRLGTLMLGIARAFGVQAVYDPDRPGIYVDGRKLGSIGLHISKNVTMHGFSLNICNAFDGFNAITTCGFDDLEITSLSKELGEVVPLARAIDRAAKLAPYALLSGRQPSG